MTQIFVTTTGKVQELTVFDLSSTKWSHPVVDKPLIGPDGEFSLFDVENAMPELLKLAEEGEIIIKTNSGTVISNTNDSPFLSNRNLFFGTQYNYSENESTSTTTSNIAQTKLILSVPNLPEGKYRLSYSFEISNNSTNGVVVGRVEYDNPPLQVTQVLVSESSFEPDDTAIAGLSTANSTDDEWTTVSGFKSNISLKGSANFYIKFLDAEAGVSAIRRARLEIFRIS